MTAALVVACLLITGGSAFALSQADAPSATVHDGAFQVAFTGEDGERMRRPYFDLAGAVPGMRTKHASMRVANTGDAAATYRIHVADLQARGTRSLDEVLEVTVRDQPSHTVIYRGRLSGMTVNGTAPLRAGEAAVYDVDIAWPDTPADDNPYQGAALTFAMEVEARQA